MSGILQLVNTFPSGGFAVKNSLRFRSSASAYLSRTPGSAGNRQTWTWSGWVKRGKLGVENALFNAPGTIIGVAHTFCFFTASDTLAFYDYTGSAYNFLRTSTQVFRDPSAWYHLVFVVDSNNATAQNRARIYVNGVEITSWSSNSTGSSGFSTIWNSAVLNQISSSATSPTTYYLDGYLAEVNFIDGQALTPSSFGAFDATSGVWQATKYSGTYGTNGFYLKFSDTTSTTTLCYDYSGNSNNWTPNNLSLTTGSTYDSMLDSPTNYDNGGTGVGNYAVLNPLYAYSSLTLSGANLNIASSANYRSGIASFGMSSGKWYWEYVVTAVGNDTILGISSNPSVTIASYPGNDVLSWGYEAQVGNKYNNGSFSAYGATYTTNDVIGVAFDADAGSLTFYKNGVSQGVAYSSLANNTYYAAFGLGVSSTGSANFGQRPFAYTPPAGFKALNTQNLPAPSIQNGAGYMAATLYTGNSGTQSIVNAVNGVSFAPDFVWLKIRSTTGQHVLSDTIRGPSVQLFSSLTNAETTESGKGITAFNSNGFTLGNELAVTGSSNLSGATYVAWQWKAGGTAVTNTAGSITSQVSANTTAGFSVVTWTGSNSSSSQTAGHGLGVAPSMVILKNKSVVDNWFVYHASATANNQYLNLNLTSAVTTAGSNTWGAGMTSSVVGLRPGTFAASTSDVVVMYCFAAIPGYSAFGSYTGNGSADGPFVFTGMRPRWIMVKRTDAAGYDWLVWDSSRNTYNVANALLQPDASAAEVVGTDYVVDLLSNGFKIRSNTANAMNASGGTYVYAAFAENPLKYSLAR